MKTVYTNFPPSNFRVRLSRLTAVSTWEKMHERLKAALENDEPHLQDRLVLTCCGIDEDAARSLGKAMESHVSLTFLDLSCNNMRHLEIAVVAAPLRHLTRLLHVDLSANPLGDEGLRGLATALNGSTLRVRSPQSSKAYPLHRSWTFMHASALVWWHSPNLNTSRFGDEGLSALAECHLPHLDRLSIKVPPAAAAPWGC